MDEIADLLSKIGWPHITLMFGIIFIVVFKTPISNFLNRVDSVGKDGVTTNRSPEAQNEELKKMTWMNYLQLAIQKSFLK
jgi:hypothetical protein